jgi:serine/threonine protein kinase
MSWVKGCHVSYLLDNHYTNSFPPFLLFRILDQVFKAEQHLQARNLCHVDLRCRENIMLRGGGHTMPYITLIDYSAVEPYI